MALTITHNSVPVVPDDPAYPVGTDEWIAAHNISGTLPPANGGTGLTLATQNLDFYVATTGSDNAAGTIGAPFLTVQKGLDTAASYDYQNLYTVTVHVADGTYAISDGKPTALLPVLKNYPAGASTTVLSAPTLIGNTTTPTNVILSNTLTNCTLTTPYSRWIMQGFRVKSTTGVVTYADIKVKEYAELSIDKIDFAGNGILLDSNTFASVLAFSSALTVSSSACVTGFQAFFYGNIIWDLATVTYTANTFASNVHLNVNDISIMAACTFVGAGSTTGAKLVVSNHSTCEIATARSTLPGDGSVYVDETSAFVGDGLTRQFGIPYSPPITLLGAQALIQSTQVGAGISAFFNSRFVNDASAPDFNYIKSRSTTPGSFAIVQTADQAGTMAWWCDDGTSYVNLAAYIGVSVAGTPGSGTVPGRMSLSVCAQGAQFATELVGFDGVLRAFQITGSLGRGAPTTHTADFSVGQTENWIINNKSGSGCVITLPAAATYPGREIMVNNYQAQVVVSASVNVVPVVGGAASTAIIAGTAGKWATLVSDATNWVIMQSN